MSLDSIDPIGKPPHLQSTQNPTPRSPINADPRPPDEVQFSDISRMRAQLQKQEALLQSLVRDVEAGKLTINIITITVVDSSNVEVTNQIGDKNANRSELDK